MTTQVHAAEGMKQRGIAGRHVAAAFGLEKEGGWQRHANPASVWTRFAALPLLVVAIWSSRVDRLVVVGSHCARRDLDGHQPAVLQATTLDEKLGVPSSAR